MAALLTYRWAHPLSADCIFKIELTPGSSRVLSYSDIVREVSRDGVDLRQVAQIRTKAPDGTFVRLEPDDSIDAGATLLLVPRAVSACNPPSGFASKYDAKSETCDKCHNSGEADTQPAESLSSPADGGMEEEAFPDLVSSAVAELIVDSSDSPLVLWSKDKDGYWIPQQQNSSAASVVTGDEDGPAVPSEGSWTSSPFVKALGRALNDPATDQAISEPIHLQEFDLTANLIEINTEMAITQLVPVLAPPHAVSGASDSPASKPSYTAVSTDPLDVAVSRILQAQGVAPGTPIERVRPGLYSIGGRRVNVILGQAPMARVGGGWEPLSVLLERTGGALTSVSAKSSASGSRDVSATVRTAKGERRIGISRLPPVGPPSRANREPQRVPVSELCVYVADDDPVIRDLVANFLVAKRLGSIKVVENGGGQAFSDPETQGQPWVGLRSEWRWRARAPLSSANSGKPRRESKSVS